MQIRVLKKCFYQREQREAQPGEIVTVPGYPKAAIEAGLVEAISSTPVPENVPDLGYPD